MNENKRLRTTSAAAAAVPSMTTSAILLMLSQLTSKMTGFIREIIVAPVIGYGVNTDAYTIGFQIPDLFYQLLIGGAIGAVLTPTLSSGIARNMERRTWRSVSIFINIFLLVMIGANVIGVLFAPFLIGLYSANHSEEVVTLAVSVTRALFPQTIFLMLAGFCGGILSAYRQFGKSAFAATMYNVFCIIFIFWWGNKGPAGPVRVAAGIALAAFLNFLWMFYRSRREIVLYRVIFDTKDRGFRQLVRLAVPTLLSGSVIQINAIVLTHFADQFTGAVTSLRYAQVTWNLPYGIFVVAVANIMLPLLSAAHANRDYGEMRQLFGNNLRRSLYMVAPFAVIFFFMGAESIRTIFQWGNALPEESLAVTGGILSWYAIALIFQTVIQITYTGFYARKVTSIALFTSILSLVLNPILCVIFLRVLDFGVYGLSLAYAVNSLIQMIVMMLLYRRHLPQAAPPRMTAFVFRLGLCMAMASIVALGLNTLPIHPSGKFFQIVVYGVKSLLVIATFYLASEAIALREASFVRGQLRRLVRR